MNRKFLVFGLTALAFSSAKAINPEVKISGGIDFQAGYFKNNNPVAEKNYITGNNKEVGFNSTAHLLVDAHNTTEAGLEYGAKVGIDTTARNARKAASSLYFISQAGKMEFGSEKSANSKMKIMPYTNACATGGGWDVWVKSDPQDTKTVYVTNFGNFLDPKTRNGDKTEYSRKITYYTPQFSGFQIGVSYVPDTTNAGYASNSTAETHNPTKTASYDVDLKNAWAGGITYENTISDDVKFKIALVGEMGKAVARLIKKDGKGKVQDATFKNLKAYTIGAQLDYQDFSFTSAYSDYMKSLSSPQLDNWHSRNTDMYGFGVRYNHPSKVSGSVTYFESKNKSNSMKATTFAVEYKGMQGLMPYAELTLYKTDGKYQYVNSKKVTEIKTDKNHGTSAILGLKLEF